MKYCALYKGSNPIIYKSAETVDLNWIRPDWPALDDLTSTNNVFTGIYGVEDHESNFASILIAVSSGTWSIDWGDGVIETGLTSNVKRDHLYDYSSIGNSPVDGVKPVVVKVTTSGGNITTIDLRQKHSQAGLPTSNYVPFWLDVAINAASATSILIGAASSAIVLNRLKKVKIYNHNVTNFSSFFNSCYSLEEVSLFNTANVTSMSNMFNNCYSLKNVPFFNTQNVTTMQSMFGSCQLLKSVPLFNTQNVTNMSNMFNNASNLESVPLFNTQNVTSFSDMFNSCGSLKVVPLFNTQNATNMLNMFTSCSSLEFVPLFNTQNVNNMQAMFNVCYSLKNMPFFNTQNVTTMQSMFNSCVSLEEIPFFNTQNVTSFNNCFSSCSNLKSLPPLNTSGATSAISMFSTCRSLMSIPTLNFTGISSAANIANIFSNISSTNLSKVNLSGIRYSISYNSLLLSSNAINTIFSGLGIADGVSGTQTINVLGNYGYSGADKSIAQLKGWSVL